MHQTNHAIAPHSGLGITAFCLSLGAGAIMVLALGVAASISAPHAGAYDTQSSAATVLGLLFLFSTLVQITALGLGIAALVQTGREKLFGVLGTVFASTGLLASVLLLLLGALSES